MLAHAGKVCFLLNYAWASAIIGDLTTKSMREMSDIIIGQLAYSCLGEAIRR